MYNKLNIMKRMIAIACVGVFALTSVPLVTDSFAADRGGRGGKYSREYRRHDRGNFGHAFSRHERRAVRRSRHNIWRHRRHVISSPVIRHRRHVVSRLPWGYKRLWHHRRPYYFSRGIFYRPYTGGFLAISAPVGAIILSLPIGYEQIWIDGTTYYTYAGTYYRRVPDGYVVVDPPARVVVEDDVPEIVPPAISSSGKVIVDAPALNVRSGPSLDNERIHQFEEGAILEVSGRSDGWLYVHLPNGGYGWVKTVFTKPLEPGAG
jgi:hypothetical protein